MLAAAILSPAAWAQNAAAQAGDSPVNCRVSEVSEPRSPGFRPSTTTPSRPRLSARPSSMTSMPSTSRRRCGHARGHHLRYNQVGAFAATPAARSSCAGSCEPARRRNQDAGRRRAKVERHFQPPAARPHVDRSRGAHRRPCPGHAARIWQTRLPQSISSATVEQPGTVARTDVAAGSFGTAIERLDVGRRRGRSITISTRATGVPDGARPDSDGRMENYFLRLGWPSHRMEPKLRGQPHHNHATDPGSDVQRRGWLHARRNLRDCRLAAHRRVDVALRPGPTARSAPT